MKEEISKSVFITGIGTDVGKTLVSAIIAQALGYDYWKPIQCGSLEFTDSDDVKSIVNAEDTGIHKETYRLKEPMSPHAAAERESIEIDLEKFSLPTQSKTRNQSQTLEQNEHTITKTNITTANEISSSKNIVVEGAGGLLVPLNSKHTILDLIIKLNLPVVVVVKNYLGSINHSLLSISQLKNTGCKIIGIIISGEANRESEEIIEKLSGEKIIFRVPFIKEIKRKMIVEIAEQFKQTCGKYFK